MMDFDEWYERTASVLLESDLPKKKVEEFLTNRQKVRQLHEEDYAPVEVLMHLRRQHRLAMEGVEPRVARESRAAREKAPVRAIETEKQRKRKVAREVGQRLVRKSSRNPAGEYIANVLLFVFIGIFTAFVVGLVLWAMME